MEEKLSYSKILDIIKRKAVDESTYLKTKYEGFITTDFTDELTLSDSDLFEKVVRIESLPIKDSDEHKRIKGRKGIYVFRVKNEVEVNYFNFNNHTAHGAPIRYSLMKIDKFSKDGCLYVGKSDNFYERMKVHFGDPNTGTGGLRIANSYRKMLQDNVVCYCFVFKKSRHQLYEYIARGIEKELNEKLNPYIGNK